MSGSDGDSGDERRARIERLIAYARRIADGSDPLGEEARRRLTATTGLSREGIELALTEHLEINPSEAELSALLGSAAPRTSSGRAPRCHVVIAANVCTSALRAIAVGLATSPCVLVRPSRRDPVLAEMLVRCLTRDDGFRASGGSIERVEDVSPSPGDELHVYGSDRTVAALSAAAAPGVVVRGHGTGFGVAVIGSGIDVRSAARAVARDVVPFDQLGCLSPRMALVEGGAERAAAVGEALHEELGQTGVPRGAIEDDERAAIAMYRASIEAVGTWREGPDHGVGIDVTPRALPLPPAARVVHVAPVSAGEVPSLLAPWSRFIAAIGADDEGELLRAVARAAPGARRSRLGAMQRPPLDGPVDRRPA